MLYIYIYNNMYSHTHTPKSVVFHGWKHLYRPTVVGKGQADRCPQPSPVAVGRRCIHLRPPRHSPYEVDSLSYPVKNHGVIRCYKLICTYCMQVYIHTINTYIYIYIICMCINIYIYTSPFMAIHLYSNVDPDLFFGYEIWGCHQAWPGPAFLNTAPSARLLEKDRPSAGGHGLPRAVLSWPSSNPGFYTITSH